jgi:aspartate dehydrogenase
VLTDPAIADLAALRSGAGSAIVLLHGIGSSATSWSRLQPLLAGHRLIAPDFPGYGDSADADGIPLAALAGRIAALIDAEGGSAHVVGLSFGALVALALAHRSPERVRSLVLADATLGRGAFPAAERDRWLAGRLAFADGIAAGAAERARAIAAPGAPDDVVAEITANMRRARPAGYRAVARIVAATDARPWLGTIAVPALVLCGAADTVVGVPLAETIADALPDARYATIAGAGHAPHVEQPAAVAAAIGAFIASVEAPDRTTRVAVAGAGAIAGVLIDGIARGEAGNARVGAIGARPGGSGRAIVAARRQSAIVAPFAELAAHAPLVIEAAGGDAVRAHAAGWLEAGADVMILSAGALIDDGFRADLLARAAAHRRRILVPSGAIAGVDGVRAGALGGLRTLTLRTTKPPRGLAGAPHIVASGIDLDALTEPTTVFSGTVAEAVRGFPSNVNVAAVLALAGRGADVRVDVVADPAGTANVQEIEASGAFGTFRVRLDNAPSPANPKTSMLAPLSALAMLRRFSESLWVGA